MYATGQLNTAQNLDWEDKCSQTAYALFKNTFIIDHIITGTAALSRQISFNLKSSFWSLQEELGQLHMQELISKQLFYIRDKTLISTNVPSKHLIIW